MTSLEIGDTLVYKIKFSPNTPLNVVYGHYDGFEPLSELGYLVVSTSNHKKLSGTIPLFGDDLRLCCARSKILMVEKKPSRKNLDKRMVLV